MQNRRYVAAVIFLTSITLLVAFLLWNSEDSQVLDSGADDGWARGPDNALVTIDTYVDFT